ncbi:alpha/beta hydrolase [Cryptosporangium aurantiacum]|uniref:Alpha/beta hydrolase family protein n=1 Tax=Cryptosporangium aurantiacum TaxID=134849 RepID=A0A1M7RJV6_9ACTN|nr:alpha/beta hydrolase [Cryptosporangium aurantiacum]SHN46593.1 Alpha/beta hydrolase family protein [Cryptosporangium aurantiacum]
MNESVTVQVGQVPLSGLVAVVPEPRSTIVAVHGAVARARYFHGAAHPDQSLLTLATHLGHTVIALDRPGYGASAGHTADLSRSDRAALYRDAVAQAVSRYGGDRVVVVSHSAGAAQASRLVVDGVPGVIGWEMCGNGLRHVEIDLSPADGDGPRDVRGLSVRDLVWGPDTLYPPGGKDTGGRRGDVIRPEPADAEVWRRELPAFAAKVGVPVRLTVGAEDRIWDHTPEALAELAAVFSAAPRVVTNVQPGAPHNMSLSHAARGYHLGVLAFAEECLLGDV